MNPYEMDFLLAAILSVVRPERVVLPRCVFVYWWISWARTKLFSSIIARS